MQNYSLIIKLREKALVEGKGSLASLLNEAADRLEEMDERLSILEENMEAAEQFDAQLQEIGVREA